MSSDKTDSFKFHVSSVLYNQTAAQFIQCQQHPLSSVDTWNALLSSTKGTAQLPDALHFPQGSLIVKEEWEVLEPCSKKDCINQIHVWDPSLVDLDPHAKGVAYRRYTSWNRSVVAVDTNPDLPCSKARDFTPLTADDPNLSLVKIPISCFHYIAVSPHDGYVVRSRAGLIDNSAGWVPTEPSFLLLVGFHIISAELPDWTWTTFWWTPHPLTDTGAAGRPDSIRGKSEWAYYAMNTTFSDTPDTSTQDGGPAIVYNPYLEGSLVNGPISNCLYCHRKAVFRAAEAVAQDLTQGAPPRCAVAIPAPRACNFSPQADSQYYTRAVPTSFLWSLTARQDPTFNPTDTFKQTLKIPIFKGTNHR